MRAQGIGSVLTSAGALLEDGLLGRFQADMRCAQKTIMSMCGVTGKISYLPFH